MTLAATTEQDLEGNAYSTCATLQFRQVCGRTVVTRCHSPAPIKLLTPKRTGPAAWGYMSSYGGGLVAGDRLDLRVEVCDDAVGVLTTQASTKVYHQQDGQGASQHLSARVATGGMLVVAPDPVTCFADARYEQQQVFDLELDASLLLLDWFTAGRTAMGERWSFDTYRTENRVNIGGQCVACDRLAMDRSTHAIDGPFTTGRYNCFATVFLVGPAFDQAVAGLDEAVRAMPLLERSPMPISFSRFAWGGILRMAGVHVEHVREELAQRLVFIEPLIGSGLWHRKW